MISVSRLTKRYGRVTAVDDISFEVKPHEIVGFLGPNGAGKTTTMRILSCFLPATDGEVRVAGMDVLRDSLAVRQRIGYLPEHVPLYPDMRVEEYLRFRGRLKGLGGRRLRERVGEASARCEIADVRRTIISRLSKGYQKRVGLADALLHEPEVLILDEPAIGLDPNQIRNLRRLIQDLARRHTVLLSSHILPEVEILCERVLIINKGRIVASGAPTNLLALMKGDQEVSAEVKGPFGDVVAAFGRTPGVARVTGEPCEGGWLRAVCVCAPETDAREAIYATVAAHGWSLRHLAAAKRSLEDVFVAVTRDAAANGEAGRERAGP